MRKKIILVLTMVFMALFLTACSTEITEEVYEDCEKIAHQIKNAEGDYKIPEGYTVEYTDPSKISQITIVKYINGFGDECRVSYDMTKNEPKIISITQEFNSSILATVICTLIIIIVVSAFFC